MVTVFFVGSTFGRVYSKGSLYWPMDRDTPSKGGLFIGTLELGYVANKLSSTYYKIGVLLVKILQRSLVYNLVHQTTVLKFSRRISSNFLEG